MNECVIGIGSNINPVENIERMLYLLSGRVEVVKVSSLLSTKPVGITNQADFVNGAVRIKTEMSSGELNIFLKALEDRLGRDRSLPKFGPRTIDLDIVVWNNKIIDKEYYTRDFLKQSVEEVSK